MGFSKEKSGLPGIEQHTDGRVSCTFTEEEEHAVNRFFKAMKDPNEETGEGTWYIHPDAHRAMTAWALMDYARSQVSLAESAEEGLVNNDLCFRKALAAATKAYSLHALPIYVFDMGCILEMLGDADSARNAFRTFLEFHREFKASDIAKLTLKFRDVDAAVREARERS